MGNLESGQYRAWTANEWFEFFQTRINEGCTSLGIRQPRWAGREFVNLTFRVTAQGFQDLDESLESWINDTLDPSNVSGAFLRSLARLLNVPISEGTPSLATLTGTAWTLGPVTVSIGDEFAGGGASDDARWVATEDVTIPAGSTANFQVACAVNGPTSANAASITRIISADAGLTAVTNAEEASAGTSPATAASVRAAIARGNYGTGARSPAAVRDALAALDGVTACQVVVNDTSPTTDITYATRSIPGYGWGIWVHPAELSTTQRAAILARLYDILPVTRLSLPTATGSDGVRGRLLDGAGIAKDVGYWFFSERKFKINIDITASTDLEPGYGEDEVSEPLQEAARLEAIGLLPGERLPQQDVIAACVKVEGVYRCAVSFELETAPGSGTYGSAFTTDLIPDPGEVLVLAEDPTVSVT